MRNFTIPKKQHVYMYKAPPAQQAGGWAAPPTRRAARSPAPCRERPTQRRAHRPRPHSAARCRSSAPCVAPFHCLCVWSCNCVVIDKQGATVWRRRAPGAGPHTNTRPSQPPCPPPAPPHPALYKARILTFPLHPSPPAPHPATAAATCPSDKRRRQPQHDNAFFHVPVIL